MIARRDREAGASLILALVFISAFALVIVSIADAASSAFLSTNRLQERRTTAYVADGATHGAIQYLRSHGTCGRPGLTCPIANFQWTSDSKTGTTTMAAAGAIFDLDRTVDLTTTVDGVQRVTARVIIRDSDAGEPRVDVQRWTYHR